MRKLLFAIVTIFYLVALAAAQTEDAGRTEIFAGFSFLKTKYRAELPDPPMPVIVAFDGDQKLSGVHASATRYLARGFGVTGDVSVHFETESLPDPLGGTIDTNIRVLTVLGGARYKFRREARVAPFVHGLAGVANTRSRLTVASLNSSGTASSTDFAMAVGGGLDVRVADHFAIRLIQADYNPVFLKKRNQLGFGQTRADNFRISFGVVFR